MSSPFSPESLVASDCPCLKLQTPISRIPSTVVSFALEAFWSMFVKVFFRTSFAATTNNTTIANKQNERDDLHQQLTNN